MPTNEQMLNFLLSRCPQVQNNPQAREMLNVIRSGDSVRGRQLAENLCRTYGVTPEQGANQAQSWLQSLMMRRR